MKAFTNSFLLILILMAGMSNSAFAAVISVVNSPVFSGAQTVKPGWAGSSVQGAIRPYDSSDNIALNGATVVSSNIPGYLPIHDDANVVDGYYGNGSSWIGTSVNSWIKIDLGSNFLIDSLSFGRDRLNNYDDRDPGDFSIMTALIDTIFSDTNTSNDNFEYTTVVDSSILGFSGSISMNDTILSTFIPIEARYIMMNFASDGVAIDEIEVTGSAVPEPSVLALLGLGLAGLGFSRKRKLQS
jgi:hypothetical protein